jgi:hypothetical protein
MHRSGPAVLEPYLFKYQYQIRKGDIADGLSTVGIITDELERRSKMSIKDKNYIQYFMLNLLPDDYLSSLGQTAIFDPEATGLQEVSKYYRDAYPYRRARAAVRTVLQK